METLIQDLKYAWRGLTRAPGFAFVAVATLALGIAATTVIFTLINTLLLRPPPVHQPDRLVTVEEVRRGGTITQRMGLFAYRFERYEALRDAAEPVFTGLAAHSMQEPSIRIDGPARVVAGILTSDNYFEVLGLRPAAGRFFSDDDAAAPVAVISHRLWQREFGGDPGVPGRVIHVDGRAMEVVGVAPAGFGGTMVGFAADVWTPVGGYRAGAADNAPEVRPWMLAIGRLRPGVSPAQAEAAVAAVGREIPTEDPNTEILEARVRELSGVPASLRSSLLGFMGVLLATAGLVLFIASINVGGLLLARAASRRREVAVRLAMGGGRGRLVRMFLTESVLLFLVGGGAGVLLTVWLLQLLIAIPLPVQARVTLDPTLDLTVLGFALAVSLFAGLAFGLAPALQAVRSDLLPALKSGDGGRGTGRNRLRRAFVVAQLAMSLLLLVTAGLFVRTLQSAVAADPGFDPNGVVVGAVAVESHGYDEEAGRAFYAALLERLEADPAIAAVGLAEHPPMSGNVNRTAAAAVEGGAGAEAAGEAERMSVDFGVADAGYFEALRIPLLAGRTFTTADRDGAQPVVVVNQTLASRLWPGQNAVGRRIRVGGRVREVVGVVADGKYEGYRDEDVAYLYYPFGQAYRGEMTVHARIRGEPAEGIRAIRAEVAGMDPDIALERAEPLSSTMMLLLFPQRLAALLVGSFGLVGLLLAGIGIYGVISYHVTRRTREIGVRMALGARRADVLTLVVRGSLGLVALGVIVGLGAAFASTRLIQGFLYGVAPTDLVTFVGVPVLLIAVALIASWIPARRATRVDPMTALRYE